MVVAPAVPIFALSFAYWIGTGNLRWFPIIFLFGYLSFIFFGVPVAAMLMLRKKRQLLNCIVAGGIVTIAPLLVLSALSMSINTQGFTNETWRNFLMLFLVGNLGGAVFWLIAFSKLRKKNHNNPEKD